MPGGRLGSTGATFTVRIDGQGVAHVRVEKGRVVVTSEASHESRDLEEGATIDLATAPPPATAPAATAPVTARAPAIPATTSVANATTPATRTLAATTPTGAAAFKLAELEMANGQREGGRARLAELTTSSDVRLASDAATLLARSEPTAAARADAWARYLATSPPIAYRDRALLERADALVDAGHTSEANALIAELRTASLTDAQRRQLERVASKASERR